MNRFFFLILLAPAAAWTQPALAPPHLGFVTDSEHSLRPVQGIAGNFVLGTPQAKDVISSAFSGSLGLSKTGNALIAFDPQGKTLAAVEAPGGSALFAFAPDGEAALIYTSGALIQYKSGRFASSLLDAAGVVAVVWPDAVIVERDGVLWKQALIAGQVRSQTALTGIQAPVLALPSGELVSSAAHGLVLTRAGGSQTHIAAKLPARFSLQQLGRDWVGIAGAASPARFALRVTPGREGFYLLPEGRQ